MVRILLGAFIVLHGLVHMWYFTLSRGLVEFQPEMGWSGRSWIFTNLLGDSATRGLASALYVVASLALAVSGIAVTIRVSWSRPLLAASAIFSSAVILLFWDGRMEMLAQKGLVGLLLNAAILVALILLR